MRVSAEGEASSRTIGKQVLTASHLPHQYTSSPGWIQRIAFRKGSTQVIFLLGSYFGCSIHSSPQTHRAPVFHRKTSRTPHTLHIPLVDTDA